MKTIIKNLFTKGSTDLIADDSIRNEVNLSLKMIQKAMPLPSRYVSVDATLYDQINVGSIDVTVPETEVYSAALKPVVQGKVINGKLKAKKYPVILVATKEQLRYSDFENLLDAELRFKLSALATKKMYAKLESTVTTPATDLGAALDSLSGNTGVIVTTPSNALKLCEKYSSDKLCGYQIIGDSSVTGTHVINDDALTLSLGIEWETSKDAMLIMDDVSKHTGGVYLLRKTLKACLPQILQRLNMNSLLML